MRHLKHYWPILGILAVVITLAITNYVPGTYLTGWDNLHPEFNFLINLKRTIFTTWQEYQGLGLLGGMGHGADLVRQFILIALASFIPLESIRYVSTMTTLAIGGIGAYFLIRKILSSVIASERRECGNLYENEIASSSATPLPAGRQGRNDNAEKSFTLRTSHFALLGALFYILNLSTLQTYYTPFETFTAHFASLPWLLLVTINYFQSNQESRIKNQEKKPYAISHMPLAILILILLLSTPAYYVPTLFIVWLGATTILIPFLVFSKLSPVILSETKNLSTAVQASGDPSVASLSQDDKNQGMFRTSHFALRTSRILKFYFIVFLINAFWLLPFAYFTVTNSSVNLNAKINQMATENIYQLNREHGDLWNLTTLKGFWFNTVEPDLEGTNRYMYEPWREHTGNVFITLLGVLIFGIILLGLVTTVRKKQPVTLAFAALFLFAIGMLATEVFPFSLLHALARAHFPFINQVFRFPYTKFSILASLMYAVFFAFGVKTLIEKTKNVLPYAISSMLFAIALVIFVFPMFQGKLFYAKEHRAIPDEYFKLFSYFAKQDPNTRIANFPQPTFWSWNYTRWGYSGSGFLWYGIKQPILDRAFDVWSKTNEGYYFELQQALYSKDSIALSNVFEKYHVNWVLIDRNFTYPVSQQAVFTTELEAMLGQMQTVEKTAVFNNIRVYKIALTERPESFVYATGSLPTANRYDWNTHDQAYADLGSYVSNSIPARNATHSVAGGPNTKYYYPFRSLFSLKTEKEQAFTMQETDKTIEFLSFLPPQTTESLLLLPSLQEVAFVPTEIYAQKESDGTVQLKARFMSPEVYLSGEKVAGSSSEKTLFTIRPTKPGNPTFSVTLNINGAVSIPITDKTAEPITTFLNVAEDNILVLTGDAGRTSTVALPGREIAAFSFLASQQILLPVSTTSQELRIAIPKITDGFLSFEPTISKDTAVRQCDLFRKGKFTSDFTVEDGKTYFRLKTTDMTACMDFYSTSLPHAQGYAIFLEYKHISGRPWHLWMVNEDEKYPVLDTFLQKIDIHTKATFVLPPQEPFGKAYSLHLDGISIGKERTENALHRLAMYPIPYDYLHTMMITSEARLPTRPENNQIIVVHPNESLYIVNSEKLKVKSSEEVTLVLSQSFDDGWKAYRVKKDSFFTRYLPFIFGKEMKTHVMINNWANGWILNNSELSTLNSQLIIVYLPQYVQYAGFLLLLGGLLLPGILLLRHRAKTRKL